MPPPPPSELARHWAIDPEVTYLNHGGYGACPREVMAFQSELRARMEWNEMKFFLHDLEGLLDHARERLAAFLRADPEELVFVDNATTGVNTVLRSLVFEPGDELLTTDHAYNACANALRAVAERTGARVVVARVPFPLRGPEEVTEAVLAAVTPRTRLALLDHVTSPTGIIFPLETLVPRIQDSGVDVLIDGAHAPGMIPLDLRALRAAYYSGNCHKWLCSPKGAAFLQVRRDRQSRIRPLTISHGANSRRTDRSRFRLEFDWMGTQDDTAVLSIPRALDLVGGLVPGGWPEVRARNSALACKARAILCQALGVSPPCPESMLGALATVPLPEANDAPISVLESDPLQLALRDRYRIEIPIFAWPAAPRRWIRVSPHLYNSETQYHYLAETLRKLLG
jgi:isopenicillin-N epimerase